jgi:hypothetical protein
VSAVLAQQKKTVPPPPKPADDEPSLEATMKFIQDKINDHGTVGYVVTDSTANGVLHRVHLLTFDVVTDAPTCTLREKEKSIFEIEVTDGVTYNEGGNTVSGDNLHREKLVMSKGSFKDVESIAVESEQDLFNRMLAQDAHPERTMSYTPAVYRLSLHASKKDAFSVHIEYSVGKQPPGTSDFTDQQMGFSFRDEQTADRIAKAMTHAVELCGGGNKEPF